MGEAARAGAIGGVAGCAVFLVLHALWIVPIWFVAPVAFASAAASGGAYGVLEARLVPTGTGWPVRVVAGSLGGWVLIGPSIIVAESGLRVGSAPPAAVVAGFVVPILGVGAVVGWLGGRTARGAGMGALAGLLTAVGPGHNIPFLAGTRAVTTELTILACVFLAAAVTRAAAESLAARRARQSAGASTR